MSSTRNSEAPEKDMADGLIPASAPPDGLIGWVIRRVLKITQNARASYILTPLKKDPADCLSEEEAELFSALFPEHEPFELSRKNHSKIREVNTKLSSKVSRVVAGLGLHRADHANADKGLKLAIGLVALGVVLSLIHIGWPGIFFVGVSFLSGIFTLIRIPVIQSLRRTRDRKEIRPFLISFLFSGGVYAGILLMSGFHSGWPFALALALPPMAGALVFLLSEGILNQRGREVMGEIEGLREYLMVMKERSLQFNNPPKLTPEWFEHLLPYAVALGVDQQWAEKFEHLFHTNASSPTSTRIRYRPSFYRGGASAMAGAAVGSALSSVVTSSLASSSGGGRSGGGGGGGGGGGW